MDRGFQSPEFRISLSKISWIPESDLPYMGLIMYYQNRIMSCRTGSKICTITDIRSPKGTLTMACPSPSLAANSCANFWNALSSPVPASTQRLIFHSWMSTVSRQILQLLCASHHPQRRAWSQWSTWWNAWLLSTKCRWLSLRCTIWLVFIRMRYALLYCSTL